MKKRKRANIDHIAHQVNVRGVGPHQNKKKYNRKKSKKKYKKTIDIVSLT